MKGFGLPGIEAMACCVAVLASNPHPGAAGQQRMKQE